MQHIVDGPWEVLNVEAEPTEMEDGETAWQAGVRSTTDHDLWIACAWGRTAEEALAHARLIVSAVELYDALKELVDGEPSKKAWVDARRALTHADGEWHG